jgi:uncharacterized membrane protein YhdT
MQTRAARTSPAEDFEHDPRYAVSLREAWWCVAYWAAFTTVMVVIAWGIAGDRDPAETTYIMGFPEWFFWTGIVTVAVFCVVPFFMVRFLFTDLDLEPEPDRVGDGRGGDSRTGERS